MMPRLHPPSPLFQTHVKVHEVSNYQNLQVGPSLGEFKLNGNGNGTLSSTHYHVFPLFNRPPLPPSHVVFFINNHEHNEGKQALPTLMCSSF
jgi:hypothetical protein